MKQVKAIQNLKKLKNENNNNRYLYIYVSILGRGPVLGSMVYGTCFCPVDKLEQLKQMGFAGKQTTRTDKTKATTENELSTIRISYLLFGSV
jgi:hypothetical protein